MTRARIIQILRKYFADNGDMTMTEYMKRTDTPMRAVLVKRYFNNWNRMLTYLNKDNRQAEVIEEVVITESEEDLENDLPELLEEGESPPDPLSMVDLSGSSVSTQGIPEKADAPGKE